MNVTDAQAMTLSQLQAAHVARQEEWCPDQKPDLSFRGNEMAGETGEACNVIKKLERERHGWRGSRATADQLAEELADVIHTAVLCAITAGIDIEPAVIAKFNATSEKNGLSTRLPLQAALAANHPPADKGEPVATYHEPAVVAVGSRYEPVYRYQTPDRRSFSQSYPDEGRPPIRPDAPKHLECLTSAELIAATPPASRDAIRREAFEEAAKALAVIERMANTIQFNGNQRAISHEDHMRAWKDVEDTAIRARAG